MLVLPDFKSLSRSLYPQKRSYVAEREGEINWYSATRESNEPSQPPISQTLYREGGGRFLSLIFLLPPFPQMCLQCRPRLNFLLLLPIPIFKGGWKSPFRDLCTIYGNLQRIAEKRGIRRIHKKVFSCPALNIFPPSAKEEAKLAQIWICHNFSPVLLYSEALKRRRRQQGINTGGGGGGGSREEGNVHGPDGEGRRERREGEGG